jgi:hypothetical protein
MRLAALFRSVTNDRYGNEFFREIRKKRKHYLKGYITAKTKQRIRQEVSVQSGTGRGMKLPALDDRQGKAANRSKAGRQNGSCGGQERPSRYEHVILSEWGARGGRAVLAKYGPEYFKELRKHRKNYPRYSEPPVIRPNLRLLAGRRNGHRGGMRRAEFYSPEHLREWGRLGGITTRMRHGNEFFRKIRKLRKFYLKGYVTRKTKQKMHQMMVDMYRAESNPFARWAMQLYLQSKNRET